MKPRDAGNDKIVEQARVGITHVAQECESHMKGGALPCEAAGWQLGREDALHPPELGFERLRNFDRKKCPRGFAHRSPRRSSRVRGGVSPRLLVELLIDPVHEAVKQPRCRFDAIVFVNVALDLTALHDQNESRPVGAMLERVKILDVEPL